MNTEAFSHISVLLEEAVDALHIDASGCYVDCTAGAGGHAEAIAKCLSDGRLIALDRDINAVKRVGARLASYENAQVVHSNYALLDEVLDELDIAGVDGILLDAGLSSIQLDDPARGFTFQGDGPLDMRMDQEKGQSAADWLAEVEEKELVQVLKDYGDVGPAKRIAKKIKQYSHEGKLSTTQSLADAVNEALEFVSGEASEVRTVFQAIRIAVNDELNALREALEVGAKCLNPGGRLVVISFHSGEDRVVKQVFRELSRKQVELYPDGRVKQQTAPLIKSITKSPILPGAEEQFKNSRSKSAKMRVAERLA